VERAVRALYVVSPFAFQEGCAGSPCPFGGQKIEATTQGGLIKVDL
jgi:hypothetical protein